MKYKSWEFAVDPESGSSIFLAHQDGKYGYVFDVSSERVHSDDQPKVILQDNLARRLAFELLRSHVAEKAVPQSLETFYSQFVAPILTQVARAKVNVKTESEKS